jgi:hypothetical protein
LRVKGGCRLAVIGPSAALDKSSPKLIETVPPSS